MSKPVRIAERPRRIPLRVQSVDLVGDEVYRVRLDPHPEPWLPGDCLTIYSPAAKEGRPYSFSGPVDASCSEFWVRRFPGGKVSEMLTTRSPGDVVEVSPPFGWFRPLEPACCPRLYVATGTGIAPFLSALTREGSAGAVHVLWGMRKELPVPEVLKHVRVDRCVSREPVPGARSGRVTGLLREVELPDGLHVYLCGLDHMIEEGRRILRARGLPDTHIHHECFFTASSSSS